MKRFKALALGLLLAASSVAQIFGPHNHTGGARFRGTIVVDSITENVILGDSVVWSGGKMLARSLATRLFTSTTMGLVPLSNGGTVNFLRADGSWTVPDHSALSGIVAAEHIRWDLTGAEDVHVDRISLGSITQHYSDIHHDSLKGYYVNYHRNHNTIGMFGQYSIEGGGYIVESRWFNLVNDEESPGVDKVYGTSSSGVKGWQDATSSEYDSVNFASDLSSMTFYKDGVAFPIAASGGGSTPTDWNLWYISPTGSDVNDGHSTSTPIQTIARLNELIADSLAAGDTVLFEAGGTWTDEGIDITTSGSYGSPIVFTSYNSGAKPIIDLRLEITGWDTPSNWTNPSGSIWYMNPTDGIVRRVWFDDEEKKEAEEFPGDMSSQYPWLYRNDATDTLYVLSATNPASTFSSILQVDQNDYVISGDNMSYVEFNNLDTRGSNYNIRMNGGHNWVLDSMDIGGYSFYGFRAYASGAYVDCDSSSITYCTFDPIDTLLYKTHINQNVEDAIHMNDSAAEWVIANNVFNNWGHDAINMYHLDTTEHYRNIHIYDNYFTAPDVSYGRAFDLQGVMTSMSGIEIYRNHIYDMPSGSQLTGSNIRFYNNIIDSIRGDVYNWYGFEYPGTGLAISNFTGSKLENNEINNNIFTRCADWGVQIKAYTGADDDIRNNTLKNNIIAYNGAEQSGFQLSIYDDDDLGLVYDNVYNNNLIFDDGATGTTELVYYWEAGGDYELTITEFNAEHLTVGDTILSNVGTDPDFVNLGSDYRVYSTSDAVDGGDNWPTWYTEDYAQETVGDPPNIGAYESHVIPTGFYISPTGSDGSGDGSIGSPWFTLNKAWTVIGAGDTLWLRGGTYEYTSTQSLTGVNGTVSDTIKIMAYPTETPVFTKDGSWGGSSNHIALIDFEGDYFYWYGLEITGFTQENTWIWYGMRVRQAEHNIFELFDVHGNGSGMVLREGCDDNLVLNGDFYENQDPLTSTPYDNADGLEIKYTTFGTLNTARGCRFWDNSDDGTDNYDGEGHVQYDSCWSFDNGFIPGTSTAAGNGNGFKFGRTQESHGTTVLRTVNNCIAVGNRRLGFGANDALCNMTLNDNIAYDNGTTGMTWGSGFNFYNTTQLITAKNNISIDNIPSEVVFPNTDNVEYNDWDQAGVTVVDTDWVSYSMSLMDDARQSDGSLPYPSSLFFPDTGTDMIDAGINVGKPYNGTAPDLGPKETDY